jgi:hypothetical protein
VSEVPVPDTLTCIYPTTPSERLAARLAPHHTLVSTPMLPELGEECGETVATLDPTGTLRASGKSGLVLLQEHLADAHLRISHDELIDVLHRQARWVYHPNGTIGMLAADQPWVDQEYTKIEWVLPDGKKWLRAEAEGGVHAPEGSL